MSFSCPIRGMQPFVAKLPKIILARKRVLLRRYLRRHGWGHCHEWHITDLRRLARAIRKAQL